MSWWKRNALALGVLVLLLPASVVVIAGNEWADYYLYRSTVPVDAQEDGTVDLGSATWGPVRAVEITDTSAYTVPDGVKLIAVAVPVTPSGIITPSCMSPQLVEQSTGRQWNEMRSQLGIPYSVDEQSACRVATEGDPALEPYELILAFGVPDDAEGPFWVEVSPARSVPRLARFSIDP